MLIQSFIIKKTHFCTPAHPHVSPHSSWSLLSQKATFRHSGFRYWIRREKRKKPPIRMTTFYSNSSLKYPLTDSRFRKTQSNIENNWASGAIHQLSFLCAIPAQVGPSINCVQPDKILCGCNCAQN